MALFNNSAASITTDVVPSPTYESWSWANWTNKFAVGCSTYSFFNMVAPSFVIVTYPISSTIILSSPCGPRDDLTILATDMAALTLLALTSLPDYLSP